MTFLARFRGVLVLALVALGLGYGCGRTSLDDGFVPDDGLGGALGRGGTGVGGATAGGQGGSGAPQLCGNGICRNGAEVCCSRIQNGQAMQSCVAAGNPMACNDGISTACMDPSQCATGQSCCLSVTNLSTTCAPAAQCQASASLILCNQSATCPSSAPRCCVQAQGLGVCLPAGIPCPQQR